MNIIKKLHPISILTITIIILISFLTPVIISAQSSSNLLSELNLTTSPLPVTLKTEPGRVITTDLRIQNSGTALEQLNVELLKFDSDDTTGSPRLLARQAGDNYFDWVTFSENDFSILPGEWKTIKMTIDVPQDAGLGYYFAPVFSRADESNDQNQEETSLRGGVAILVLLEVYSKDAVRELRISDFISKKGLYEYLPANFTLNVANTGNIHTVPSGNIFIYKDGKQIDLIEFNQGGGSILPGSSRTFNGTWDNGFPRFEPTGNNDEMKLVWNWDNASNLRFGKYTATAFLVYDDGERDVPIEATVSFWVIPWKVTALGLLLLGLVLVGIYTTAKRFIKKSKKNE